MRNKKENGIDSQGLNQTWQFVQATVSQAPEQLKQWAERLPELVPDIDIDLQEKRKVYLIIAEFLCNTFQKPLPVSLRATYILCNETDPRLLLDGVLVEEGRSQEAEGRSEVRIGSESSTERKQRTDDGGLDPNGGKADDETQQLVKFAKEVILTIKVLYEPLPNRSYNRQIKILWLKNDQPTAVKVEQEVLWDYLPEDVRDKHLRSGADALTFKLYP